MSKEWPVNSDCYQAMFNKFLYTKIEEDDIGSIWFQQDDVTGHMAEAILDVLRPLLANRIINRRADDIGAEF